MDYETITCKYCGAATPKAGVFCMICGERLARKKREAKREITVPKPRQLKSGQYNIELRREGLSITRDTAEACTADALKARREWLDAEAKGEHAPKPEPLLLKDAIDKYIESKRARIKARTVQQYEYIRDKRFAGLMGLDVHAITSDDLDDAVEKELRKPSRKGGTVAPKTVIDAYGLVASVIRKYNKGVELDVDLPENPRKFRTVLSPEEIFPAVKGTDVELPCLLSMWFTFSMSEIRGFTKSKSLRGNKLYMVETVVDTNGKPERRQGGKEEERPRVHEMPPYMMGLINAVEGDVLEPRSGHAVYMRFQKCLEDAGLPKMRFHDLRHVAASVMAEEEIPTVVSQERGGWKTDSTMKGTYFHAFSSGRRAADAKINARFERIVNGGKLQNSEQNSEREKEMQEIQAV